MLTYIVLILARLYRYRLTFASILASSNTTKSRFMRLYILCLVWILVFIPTQAYVLYINLSTHRIPYSWSEAHDMAEWDNIIMTPSYGAIIFDRWVWLGSGVVTFIFFGLGREAVSMYRSGLLAIGAGRIFPSLRPEYASRNSTAGTVSSLGSKAKLYFKRKSSTSSWHTDTSSSRPTSVAAPVSPKNMAFLETITEDRLATQRPQTSDLEKALGSNGRQSMIGRMLSAFKLKQAGARGGSQGLYLANMSSDPLTADSAVSTGEASPTMSQHASTNSIEIIVRKEVRQGSETAETVAN